MQQPPTPPGLPFLGNVRGIRSAAHRGLLRAREQYGDVVHYHIARRHLYFFAHPDDVKYILVDNNRSYHKGRGLQKTKPLLGEGLLTSEGEFWRRQRRLAQPAFHRDHVARLGTVMTSSTSALLERWHSLARAGEAFNVAEEMMRLTLDIVTRALFSTALTPDEFETVSTTMDPLLHDTVRRAQAMFEFMEKIPTPGKRRMEQYMAGLDGIVYSIIEERRRSGAEHHDLLGMLMSAQDEETGESMTDRQLRDEVMTLFLAGHETTALLLSWLWVSLSRHPDVRRRCIEEVDQVLGGRVPTAADMATLPYLSRTLSETLRIYPPAWAIQRKSLVEHEISGYRIPAGCSVLVSPYVTHRHPEFWQNPEGFDPERFTPEQVSERHRFAYFPFGGGPRLCIGNNFAITEATLASAMMLQHYEIDLVPGHSLEEDPVITLRPKHGIPVRLRARRDST